MGEKLKSDLRGIETQVLGSYIAGTTLLKSDLRGIETISNGGTGREQHRLKSDLRGIETLVNFFQCRDIASG